MTKLTTAIVLFALGSTTLYTAVSAQVPVTSENRPNEHTLTCLEAPTRDCAFKAALQTVIAESFGIERAKVLIGVGRSMIATGRDEEAKQTLMLALDEARSVRLSLVTQEKITQIAPLLARAGDTAGALALVEELKNDSIKDQVLLKIAEETTALGKIADARVALRQTQNQSRAFWRELSLLGRSPRRALAGLDTAKLETAVRASERVDVKYRGLIQLAIIADRMGRPGDRNALINEADELFPSLTGIYPRAEATADRARSMFDAGMNEAFVEASYTLAILHGDRLRGNEAMALFASRVGPIEAASGNLEGALARLEFFEGIDEKARYVASLRGGRDNSSLAVQYRELLGEIVEQDGAYERDLIRMILLDGALENKDLTLMRRIVEEIEDDDNQAYGLVLMAPLLE
jgi:hypothetical protein